MSARQHGPVWQEPPAGPRPGPAPQAWGAGPSPEPAGGVTVRFLPGSVSRFMGRRLLLQGVLWLAVAALITAIAVLNIFLSPVSGVLLSVLAVGQWGVMIWAILRTRRAVKIRDSGSPYLVLDREGLSYDNTAGTLQVTWGLVASASWEYRSRQPCLVLRLVPDLSTTTPGVVSSLGRGELPILRRSGVPVPVGLTDPPAEYVAHLVAMFTGGRLTPRGPAGGQPR